MHPTVQQRFDSIYPLFTGPVHLAPEETLLARAPMRWMWTGWRDVPRVGGGDCSNAAISAYAQATLRWGDPGVVRFRAPDVGVDLRLTAEEIARRPEAGQPHAILRALLHAAAPPAGLELTCTAKGVPAATGLGSSAALQVAVIQVLAAAAGRDLTPVEQIHAARLPETHLLGLSCGFMDQGAAVHGGIANYRTSFAPGVEEVEIVELAVDDTLLQTLEACLLVIDFGQPHSSHAAHMEVFERLEAGLPDSRRAFALLAEADAAFQAALASGSLGDFVTAQGMTWQAQHLLHPDMILPQMHALVERLSDRGLLGANVNGAGMGGTLSMLVAPDAVGGVVSLLQGSQGVRLVPCNLDRHGARCWRQHAGA